MIHVYHFRKLRVYIDVFIEEYWINWTRGETRENESKFVIFLIKPTLKILSYTHSYSWQLQFCLSHIDNGFSMCFSYPRPPSQLHISFNILILLPGEIYRSAILTRILLPGYSSFSPRANYYRLEGRGEEASWCGAEWSGFSDEDKHRQRNAVSQMTQRKMNEWAKRNGFSIYLDFHHQNWAIIWEI